MNRGKPLIDMTGRVYERWTVLERAANPGRSKATGAFWKCKCKCGTIDIIYGATLRQGTSKSCGCLNRELFRARVFKHGCGKRGAFRLEYQVWCAMRQRCNNPNCKDYPDYGARGIRISPEWDEFPQFLDDMGPRPPDKQSIDRVDNDGPYSKENCRWATWDEQQDNRIYERKGSNNGHAKLTEDDVRDMRAAAAAGVSSTELGKKYSLRPSYIRQIVDRKYWKHVA